MPKFLFHRGLESKLPTLSEGEPGFTTDTEKLFMGSTIGNIQFAKQSDVDAHTVTLGTKANQSDLDTTNSNVATNTSSLADLATNVHDDNSLQTKISNASPYSTINIADTVNLTAPLVLKNGIKIKGNGKLVFNVSSNYIMDFSGLQDILIEGIEIVVNGSPITIYGQGLFNFYNSKNIKIRKNKITSVNRTIFNFTGNGTTGRSINIDIYDNDLTTTGTDSGSLGYVWTVFSTQRTDATTITTPGNKYIRFRDNYLYDGYNGTIWDFDNSIVKDNKYYNITAPIDCLKVKNSSFIGNSLKAFNGNGLCLGNGSDDLIQGVAVLNNILDGKDDNGTQISTVNGINVYKQGGDGDSTGATHPNIGLSRKITITGNVVRNCGANGIFAYGNGNMAIVGNTCADNLGSGISVSGGGGASGIHPGKVTVSNNYCKDNGAAGISIGNSSLTSIKYITAIGNVCVENGRGMYLSKLEKSIIAHNMLTNNTGVGMFANNCINSDISHNEIEDNLTGTDSDGYTGNLALGLAASNDVIFNFNKIANASYYMVSPTMPTYAKGNKGFPNKQGMFIERNFEAIGTTQTVTQNVPLPSASSWNSGQLLVQFSAARGNSSNPYAAHQNCLAIVTAVRYASIISIGEIKYISQNQATDPTNGNAAVAQATISVAVNADNNSIDITGNSNYSSTTTCVLTISPLRSALFNNYFYA